MYTIERQDEILKILEQNRSSSVSALAKQLFVSAPTIRRDLAELERQGKIFRTHGGVVLRQAAETEIPLLYREQQNSIPKQIIAQKAAEFIRDGEVIFLDASSTAAHLIPHLKRFSDIIVITNSPKASIRLGEAHIRNYCTGGLLLGHSIAYVGYETEHFIAGFNADRFFFSSRGYMEGGSITDSSPEEANVKKSMLKQSAHAYYLCDSSKKNRRYMYNICSVHEIDGIIGEDTPPQCGISERSEE